MSAFGLIAIAYLVGSIPFGYLIVRLAKGADVRETGSGGTGATNVTRRAGRAAGVMTLILDTLKGVVAVLIARWLAPDFNTNWWVAGASFAAIVGHVFPVWLGFRGGKGVATALGAYAGFVPLAALGAVLVLVLVVSKTRYVSLGSMVACGLVPLFVFLSMTVSGEHSATPFLFSTLAGSLLIIYMHRGNIHRLLAGNENKFA